MEIYTNNPTVRDKYPNFSRFLEGDVMGVLIAVRDEIHKGAVLINHPQSGNFELNESPYKSIVLDKSKGRLHFDSLQLIEHAISTLTRLPKVRHIYNETALEDFRVIDLDLVDSAVPAQANLYNQSKGAI